MFTNSQSTFKQFQKAKKIGFKLNVNIWLRIEQIADIARVT